MTPASNLKEEYDQVHGVLTNAVETYSKIAKSLEVEGEIFPAVYGQLLERVGEIDIEAAKSLHADMIRAMSTEVGTQPCWNDLGNLLFTRFQELNALAKTIQQEIEILPEILLQVGDRVIKETGLKSADVTELRGIF